MNKLRGTDLLEWLLAILLLNLGLPLARTREKVLPNSPFPAITETEQPIRSVPGFSSAIIGRESFENSFYCTREAWGPTP